MPDFAARLRDNAHLLSLLSHYARLGAEDRAAWRDRVMRMDGVGPEGLTLLHGELIAFGWVEQNTGHARLGPDGALSACYRVTPSGLREVRRVEGVEAVEEQIEVAEKVEPRFARRTKEKGELPAAVTSE